MAIVFGVLFFVASWVAFFGWAFAVRIHRDFRELDRYRVALEDELQRRHMALLSMGFQRIKP